MLSLRGFFSKLSSQLYRAVLVVRSLVLCCVNALLYRSSELGRKQYHWTSSGCFPEFGWNNRFRLSNTRDRWRRVSAHDGRKTCDIWNEGWPSRQNRQLYPETYRHVSLQQNVLLRFQHAFMLTAFVTLTKLRVLPFAMKADSLARQIFCR